MFAGKRVSGKWEAFKSVTVRVQSMRVLIRVKGKVGSKEPLDDERN